MNNLCFDAEVLGSNPSRAKTHPAGNGNLTDYRWGRSKTIGEDWAPHFICRYTKHDGAFTSTGP